MAGRPVFLTGLGLLAGFASAFLGIGGGLVIVPVLMIAQSYSIKRAVGTSLATIVPVSLVGVVTESIVKASNVHWVMGLVLTAGSLLGSWVGGRLLARLAETPLRYLYAAVLVVAAHRMFLSAGPQESAGSLTLEAVPGIGYGVSIGVGFLAGLSSVLFGIGGGIVMVPALSLLFVGFPFHVARATSLVTIVPTSILGAVQHSRLGTVDRSAVKWLAPGGVLGAIVGVITVNLLPARPCRLIFALFLILAAARLITLRQRPQGAEPDRGLSAEQNSEGGGSTLP